MVKNKQPKELTLEEIPMPPDDEFDEGGIADELDNDENTIVDEEAAQEPQTTVSRAPIAKLEFINGVPGKTVPLRYGFIKNGEQVEKIFVRRLSIGEVGDLIDQYAGVAVPKWELYAAMTGYTAAELRGLIDTDGDDVTGTAYDFLPRIFLTEAEINNR